MITALILDADGVLINGERFSDFLARDFDIDKVKEREFFTGIFQECLVGKADLKESVAPYLPSFKWPGTVDEFLEYWFKGEHKLNDELMNYVQVLRKSGIKVVLATEQEKYRTQYMLESMGFKDALDKIYSSAIVGYKKSNEAFFSHIVKDLNVNKNECVFWDNEQHKLEAANRYGINTELYKDFETFLKVMHDKYKVSI